MKLTLPFLAGLIALIAASLLTTNEVMHSEDPADPLPPIMTSRGNRPPVPATGLASAVHTSPRDSEPETDGTGMSVVDLISADPALLPLPELEANDLPNPEDGDRIATDLPAGENFAPAG